MNIEKDGVMVMLDDEISALFERLKTLEPEGNEYNKVIKSLVELYRLRIDETKVISDYSVKADQIEFDWKLKSNQQEIDLQHYEENAKTEQKNKILDWAIRAAELGLPLVAYGIWVNKGFTFEETGTITSLTFRNLIGKFKPKK